MVRPDSAAMSRKMGTGAVGLEGDFVSILAGRCCSDALAGLCANAKLPILHAMMGTLEHKAAWFARLQASGVPVFDDAEEMCVCAGLLARHKRLNALR